MTSSRAKKPELPSRPDPLPPWTANLSEASTASVLLFALCGDPDHTSNPIRAALTRCIDELDALAVCDEVDADSIFRVAQRMRAIDELIARSAA
jgi:hypothetical protein